MLATFLPFFALKNICLTQTFDSALDVFSKGAFPDNLHITHNLQFPTIYSSMSFKPFNLQH